jgi:hypothetical protein
VREAIDEMKAAYDATYFEKLSRVNKNLKGYFLRKSKGYWGIKNNRAFGENVGVPDNWRGMVIRAMEMSGFMQERTGPAKLPMLVGDFGTDIMLRSQSAAAVVGKAEVAKVYQQVLLHKDIVPTLAARHGEAEIARIRRRVAQFTGGDIQNPIERTWRRLLSNWARALTQNWYPTWLRNALSGTARIAAKLGMARTALAAIKPSWSAWKDLKQFSPELRQRWEGGQMGSFFDTSGAEAPNASFFEALNANLKGLASLVKPPRGVLRGDVRRGMGRSWQALLDRITIGNFFDAVPAIVAYKHFQTIAPKNLTGEARKRWAAEKATRAFEETANTATTEYANDFQLDARESAMVASFIPFSGDTAKMANMVYQAVGKARASGERGDWGDVIKLFAVLGIGMVLSSAVSALRKVVLGKEEEALQAAGVRMIQEVGQSLPGGTFISPAVGLAAQIVTGKYGQSDRILSLPFIDMAQEVAYTATQFAQAWEKRDQPEKRNRVSSGEHVKRGVISFIGVAGQVFGFPGQYVREISLAIDGWTDQERR